MIILITDIGFLWNYMFVDSPRPLIIYQYFIFKHISILELSKVFSTVVSCIYILFHCNNNEYFLPTHICRLVLYRAIDNIIKYL